LLQIVEKHHKLEKSLSEIHYNFLVNNTTTSGDFHHKKHHNFLVKNTTTYGDFHHINNTTTS